MSTNVDYLSVISSAEEHAMRAGRRAEGCTSGRSCGGGGGGEGW